MKNIFLSFIALALLAGISSCSKEKPDQPPAGGTDPNITVNFSLDSLIARYNGNPYLITQDLTISAVVVGDDSSGTFYKGLDIEDSTAGIMLMIDGKNLYEKYPMGTRLFVNLKGLYLVYYKGAYEIVGLVSGTTYTGIPTTVTTQFITTGKWGLYVAPKVVTIAQLNGAGGNAYMAELIELDSTQFAPGSNGVPYVSSRVNLRDCSGEDLIQVYTSQYTTFGNTNTPMGKGTFIGVYTTYNGSPELLVRDPSDLTSMTGTPCP